MATTTPTWAELIPGWPEGAPTTGIELRRTDLDGLREHLADCGASPEAIETVLAVRRHLILAALSSSEPAAHSVEGARAMIESRFLYPLSRKWVVYPLRKDRTRVVAAREGGGADAVKHVSRRIPTPHDVLENAPLPDQGVYLVLYGGSPEILSLSDRHGRTVESDLAGLLGEIPVADVVFRHVAGGEAVIHSLLAGCGARGREAVAFPDLAVVERLRPLVTREHA